MSIGQKWSIVCDHGDCCWSEELGSMIHQSSAEHEAKKRGWQIDPDTGSAKCPTCVRNPAQEATR